MVKLPKRVEIRGEGITDTEVFIMMETDALAKQGHGYTESQVRAQLVNVYNRQRPTEDNPFRELWTYLSNRLIDRVDIQK